MKPDIIRFQYLKATMRCMKDIWLTIVDAARIVMISPAIPTTLELGVLVL